MRSDIESAPTWFTVQLAPDGTSTAAMVNDENGLPPPPDPPHSCSEQAALREAVRAQPVQQLSLGSGVRQRRPAATISAPSTAHPGSKTKLENAPRVFGYKGSEIMETLTDRCAAHLRQILAVLPCLPCQCGLEERSHLQTQHTVQSPVIVQWSCFVGISSCFPGNLSDDCACCQSLRKNIILFILLQNFPLAARPCRSPLADATWHKARQAEHT